MALTKEIVVDKIEILESGQIQVRRATRIKEDGVILSQSYHRHVLNPEDSLEGQDTRVVSVANTVWTPTVIAKYRSKVATETDI